MTFREFHNALRVLRCIDYHEVEHAMSKDVWPQFRDNPHDFFIGCDDATAEAIWAVMEARMKK